jgi:hypothetical protein
MFLTVSLAARDGAGAEAHLLTHAIVYRSGDVLGDAVSGQACDVIAIFAADAAGKQRDQELVLVEEFAEWEGRGFSGGQEETLTVHRLRVPAQLRRTLASTNVIESAFSIVETVCRNVKRWRPGDHVERWVGSGLLVAERQFRKVQGYREIPALLTALANMVSKKGVAEEGKVAYL